MMQHEELDPSCPLRSQYADRTGLTTVLLNVFRVDLKDEAAFRQAWQQDAEFFKKQPGYISAQLHRGIGDSRMWFNYAVFENTSTFAATNDQPEFGPLRGGYPDSAVAHPHLFRRIRIPGICVGEQ
ncbi:antibiotic biosynthesis monooxygenase [Sphingosinicellaceae bacterium]|nr:antibiotic biosynthesis monooxygenase [Sphingosinicellaceae bacterium]